MKSVQKNKFIKWIYHLYIQPWIVAITLVVFETGQSHRVREQTPVASQARVAEWYTQPYVRGWPVMVIEKYRNHGIQVRVLSRA